MSDNRLTYSFRKITYALPLAILAAVSLVPKAPAQDRDDRYHDRDHDRDRVTEIQPGTIIAVRPNESIDVERKDNRVYYGIVDQDVRGDDGRLAIPRGSQAELIVRVAHDNDLVIDVASVTVNGERYAIKTDKARAESRKDDSLVGSIVGAIEGGEVRGRSVRIPRDTLLTFRIQRPLMMGVADRGVDRNGRHYHDYDDY